MCSSRLVVACLGVISLLWFPGTAASHGIDPCQSSCELHADVVPAPLFVCPAGDTDAFIEQGFWISITVFDFLDPIPNIPPFDFWLIDNDPVNDLALCGGSRSSDADSLTNAEGMTTMSQGTLIAGGCADGMALVVQGFVLEEPCGTWKTLPIQVRSPDIDGSSEVDLMDLSIFASSFPPGPYESCCDFDLNGVVDLVDLSRFARHFGPPGHRCN